jgi:tellurite methyltransferase
MDCGCGNGRDSYYLSNRYKVLGIDISNKPKDKNIFCNFELNDFCKCNKSEYDLIYSRFTFHSITNEQQEEFIKTIENGSYLCIETRSDKSYNINKYYGDDHYRNYTNINYLTELIKRYNFEILYLEENKGFASYKDEDPICIRLIASKKN